MSGRPWERGSFGQAAWLYGVSTRKDEWRQKPFAVTLSSDGTLVAEGGDGFIRLYRIQPVRTK